VVSAILVRLLVMFPLLPMYVLRPMAEMLVASVWINVMLAVFNLLPVPPLDGSKILMGVLPRDMARSYEKLEPFGFILLLVLFYLGVISRVIMPIIRFTHNFLLG
jgi:Zn-dependent protease